MAYVIIWNENSGRVNKFIQKQVSTIKQEEASVPGPSYIIYMVVHFYFEAVDIFHYAQ